MHPNLSIALKVVKTNLDEIRAFRILFLKENNFQFIYNKCHDYGWADVYLFTSGNAKIGYGAVWGTNKREDRDTIFEFYVIPQFRNFSSAVFREFYNTSGASVIECQSNDLLLSTMLFEYSRDIQAEAILFEDHYQTHFNIPGISFLKHPGEQESEQDVGGYVIEQNGAVVASGGFMLNYNMPYADIYMEVKEAYRQKGFGSLIIQELKKEIYSMGRVPAARCNIHNRASKATLLKAGFKICGFILKGSITELV